MRKRIRTPAPGDTKAFTIEGFAVAHNVGRNTVLGELSSGRLKGRKVGRRTLITEEDAASWRQNLPLRATNTTCEP
jgi:hypothetical protein